MTAEGFGVRSVIRTAVPADEDSDRPLGFATLLTDPLGDLEMEDLFVDPAHRRRGIAGRLVLDAARPAVREGWAG
jgi:GNAT superfamily N-acetyltransferase